MAATSFRAMPSVMLDDPLVPNIDDRGIAARRRLGVAAFGTGGVATVVLGLVGIPWSALATFPFFWVGALGLLQAREKT